MADETEILDEARRLIQLKRYEQARGVLWAIRSHPTAKQWLTKLDELDSPFVTKLPQQPNTAQLSRITKAFVKSGWKINSQTPTSVALETKKLPKYWKEVGMFVVACIIAAILAQSLVGMFIAFIAAGLAMNMFLTPKSKRANAHLELLSDGSVDVTSNRRNVAAIYPHNYQGRVRT